MDNELINKVVEELNKRLSDSTLKNVVLEINNEKLKEIIEGKDQEIQSLKIQIENLTVADDEE